MSSGLDVESPSNPLIKRARRLRRGRKDGDPSFVEGIAPVGAAVAAGAEVEMVLHAPGLVTGEGGRALIDEVRALGLRLVSVSTEAFLSLSSREAPAGVAALVMPKQLRLDELVLSPSGVVVALHEPGNPGNLGTIVRTADAAGCEGMVVIGASTDPFGAEAVKASMGTVFDVPVAMCGGLDELFAWARSGQMKVVATSARGTADLWAAGLTPPCVLLFGSERHGLPPQVLDDADLCVSIQMSGTAGSLNLAVAAGIIVFEVTRRARATP